MNPAIALHSPLESFDLSEVYESVPRLLADVRLPGVILEIVSLFDGFRSVEEVVNRAQISTTKTQSVVKKLTAMGVIRPVPTSTFSPEEEAFFETDVAPIDECDLPFETLSLKLRRAAQRITRR
ncbi:MAG: hypothetical protein JRH20_01605 [Deltaproteobacteria bacterium]|nr:hypothetical protein [Deltaproteobacteria bacterium]